MTLARYLVGGCLVLVCLQSSAAEPVPPAIGSYYPPNPRCIPVAPPQSPFSPCLPYPSVVPPVAPVPPEPGKEPSIPPIPPTSPSDAFARAPEGGTQTAASFSPNTFGDIFGSRGQHAIIPQLPIIIPGKPGTPPVIHSFGGKFFVTDIGLANFNTIAVGSGFPPQQLVFTFNGPPLKLPGVNSSFPTPLVFLSKDVVNAPNGLLKDTQLPLLEQNQVRQVLLQESINQFGPGGTLLFLGNTGTLVNPTLSPIPSDWNISTLYNYIIPGTPGMPDQVIQRPAIILDIPSPTAGGLVGRTKISDGNNPLPRDRIIFDYDYFDSVPLTPQTNNVHRFSPGFEKTFFDQRASIEVRLPFASTVSSDILADGITSDGRGEFGNVHITLKGLLYEGPIVNVAAGLGIAIPTASDVTVSLLDGTKLVRINNDAWVLTPYFAFLVTPTDRLFFQNWYQFGFNTNGNSVQANPDFTGLQPVGRLTDQALLQIDAQVGYWVYRSDDSSALLRGVAPFVELHYNSTMGKADSIQAGAFTLGDPNNHIDELNLSAGFTLQIGDNLNLCIGAVAPLKGHEDRTFNWQAGIHGSWIFGASRQRTPTASSF